MIETIAHIADIHFRNIQRHNEFRAICENFFDQMKRMVITDGVDQNQGKLTY